MMNEIDTHVPCMLHSVSHLLQAVLASGVAIVSRVNTKFNVRHTCKCTQKACYRHAQRGGVMKCITMYNSRMV